VRVGEAAARRPEVVYGSHPATIGWMTEGPSTDGAGPLSRRALMAPATEQLRGIQTFPARTRGGFPNLSVTAPLVCSRTGSESW